MFLQHGRIRASGWQMKLRETFAVPNCLGFRVGQVLQLLKTATLLGGPPSRPRVSHQMRRGGSCR